MQIWMWLAAGGALLVAEMLTVDLLFASLAFSAFMAAIANAMGYNMAVQGFTFGVAAILSLFILRPIALKYLRKTAPNFATNVDALVGADALALTEINDLSGQVKLNGETWSARTQSGVVASGLRVEVLSIEGATAVIKLRG